MTPWRMWRPPGAAEEIARWTVAEPVQLHDLRVAMQRAVIERQLSPGDPAELLERLLIVATELAGNALRHGRPPTVVSLRRAGDDLILNVVDNDPEGRPHVEKRRPGAGGLGLPLAERMARHVGWYRTGSRKHVWAVLARTADQGSSR